MGRIDLSELPEVPKKIEGLVVIDDMTVAISNDNDFDIGEFDAECNDMGSGVKSHLLVIRLEASLLGE